MYSGFGVAFDGAGTWNFGNDYATNVAIFGTDNSSSSHAANSKNNFLVLGEGLTYSINGNFSSPEKRFSINFSKPWTKLCLSLYYNHDNSYLFVDGKEMFKFKANNKNVNFPTQLCLESISNAFVATNSLKGNVYNFSIECNAIDGSDILNIHKYLMVKNNLK